MKRFLIGGTIGLIVIAVGIGMSLGKIKVPHIVDIAILDNSPKAIQVPTPIIQEEKVEKEEGRVTYTLSVPRVSNTPLLDQNIQDAVELAKKSIADLAKEISFEGESSKYSLQISYEVVRNDEKITVIKLTSYEYTGGAHGNPGFTFFMYDVQAKRMIGEDEIFINRDDQVLLSLVADSLMSKPEFSFEDGNKKVSVFFDSDKREVFLQSIKDSGSIALSAQGVLFKFGAYSIGPYVIGEPQIEILHAEVADFLTPYAKNFFE